MEVHVNFRGRKPVPQHVDIGMERENKVTVLCFEGLPKMEGSTAYLHIDLGDNSDVIEIIDGQADVKRTLTQFTGSVEAFVEVLGANDRVWHSQIMELFVGRLPILGEKIKQEYPTAFEQALAQTAADKAAAAKSAADAAATAAGIVTEETARKDAESKRVAAETARKQAEETRAEHERLREKAEGERVKAETARKTAEANREQAEAAREKDTAAAVKRTDDLVKSVEAKLKNGDFVGAQGPQGPIGATGPQGVQGVQGEKGEKGEKGDTGATGPQGEKGADGADGAPGQNGKDGLDAPQIDDTTVSDAAPWSSQHIVDMLCPPIEESGNPVVCYPVAGSKLGVTASWEPTQEGSGEPYPAGGGKNLLNVVALRASRTVNGITWTVNSDGSITVSGTTTGNSYLGNAVDWLDKSKLQYFPAGTYSFGIKGTNVSVYFYGFYEDGEKCGEFYAGNKKTFDRAVWLTLQCAISHTEGGKTVSETVYPMTVAGSDVPTAFAPYANIRPIHGRTAVSVERCGENLLNITPFTKLTKSGVTYEYVANGGVHISGTATANVDSPMFTVGHLPPGKYYGLDMGTGIAASIVVQRKGSNGYLWLNAKGVFEIQAGDVIKYWYMIANNGVTLDKTVYPYIVPGTSAPAEYAPYVGSTTTLTLPSTIYGADLQAGGVGQETWAMLTLDGTENWIVLSSNIYYAAFGYAPSTNTDDGFCSHLPYKANGSVKSAYVNKNGAVVFYGYNTEMTVTQLKDWLAAQYAAGTPVQIAYKLATPIPFTATGGGTVKALSGTNTVLTDADTLTVKGRADPIRIIQQLQAASAASAQALADVERAVTDI